MAFSDLISKPIAAPFEGFDKALLTGVELANSQYKNQLAMEQNQLEKEKVQISYLDKANNVLPNLLKASGKGQGILMNSYMNLMAKGGMPVNQESMELILSDKELTPNMLALLQEGRAKYGNDPMGLAMFLAQKLNIPAADTYAQIGGIMKQQEAAKSAMSRLAMQRAGIKETAVAGAQLKRLYKVSDDTNKVTEDTSKQLGTINRSINSIESALASNDYKRLQTIIGDLAKGVGGLSGVLSDLDMKTQLARSLGTDVAGLEGYLTGSAKIPKATRDQIKGRMIDFKNALSEETTSKLLGQIGNRQMDPTMNAAYMISQQKDKSGKPIKNGLQIGFASARLLDRSNKVLQQLNTAKGEISLEAYLNKQAAPLTQEQIMKVIQDAAKQKIIIRFSPASVVQPPSEEQIYGLQQFQMENQDAEEG